MPGFLKQVDEMTSECTAKQLAEFVHELARILPESQRADFIKRLRNLTLGGGKGNSGADGFADARDRNANAWEKELREAYQRIRENLKIIDSQELTITGTLNEEYDEWYNNGVEAFLYEDPEGISEKLEEACAFVHTCMDAERYQEGYKIGAQLLEMRILCINEYDGEELSIADLEYHNFLDADLEQMILDTLYCAYHAIPLKKRPEILYGIFKNAERKDITLEAVLQHGDAGLSDFQKFLPDWIAYLGIRTGQPADRLLQEAVEMVEDNGQIRRYAEQLCSEHPGLYLSALEHADTMDLESAITLGVEAVRKIPQKYIVRSRAALITAEYVLKSGSQRQGRISVFGNWQETLEACYLAAFASDTSAVNYLRAVLNGYGTVEKRKELHTIVNRLPLNTQSYYWNLSADDWLLDERKENRPDGSMIQLLRFLDGQFAEVLSDGLNVREALGWSGTFMKQGIAAYLLYLYDGSWVRSGIAEMANLVKSAAGFSAEHYMRGLKGAGSLEGLEILDERELFFTVFTEWKSITVMEPVVRTRALERIEKLLERRVEGIMGANRRNYYEECAAFIAALGEVRESLGDAGAKQQLMTSYKNRYPRRNAFRAAMKSYGWLG